MKSLLVVFVTCLVLCFSVVEMYDFDYCCLDCIPRSHQHIACRSGLSPLPSSCRTFNQMSDEEDSDARDETTTSRQDSSPGSIATSSTLQTTSQTTPQTTPNNVTQVPVDESTSTTDDNSTAPNASAHHHRFKRQSLSSDLMKNRVDENDVLKAINEIRRNWVNDVSVSNMEEIVYDEELGDIAEAAAKRCNSVKNFCADTPGFEVKILTYNVTSNTDNNLTAKIALDHWTRGRQQVLDKAKTDNIYRRSDENTDSFTILIWTTTSKMGCSDAINQQFNTKLNKNETTYQITCLFGPAGNKIGELMWAKGEACSACPPQTICGNGKMCLRAKPQEFELDKNRTSRCVQERDDLLTYDDERNVQEVGRFRDFDTGVKVVLKPRKICDKISSSGTRSIDRFWTIAAGFLLLHANKWITHIF